MDRLSLQPTASKDLKTLTNMEMSMDLIMENPDLPVGGRLQQFAPFWDKFATDSLVRGVLQEGYRIPFTTLPRFTGVRNTPLIGQYANVLLDEVATLSLKGAIEVVSDQMSAGYYSMYFLVPKKTGDLRPILNLKPINGLISSPKFKMETLATVIKGLSPGEWLAAVDLKDAYFHLPIYPDHRKYLRFAIQGTCYQYKVLPFGLTTSPRVFTKMLAPVMGYLRLQGVKVFPYLDDILFSAGSKQALEAHISLAVRTLTRAGFVINTPKSSLTPSQDMVFIGARLQMNLGLVSLPPEKASNLIKLIKSFKLDQAYTARRWLVLLGVMASTLQMVQQARLHMRPIQMFLQSRWNRATQGLEYKVTVNQVVLHHLQWWRVRAHLLSGLPLSPAPVQDVITTDASSLGWGGVLGEEKGGGSRLTVQGEWDMWQAAWHINRQEMMAVWLTLKHFLPQVQGKVILVRSDNTTTCAYINKSGGTRSRDLCQLALEMLGWCIDHQIELRAVHVPGVDNVLADFLSRQRIDPREWGLHHHVVNWLFKVWDRPNIDLFASIHNHKLPVFCSLYPSPMAVTQDAFSIDWGSYYLGYAFPPPIILMRVLQKVRMDRARLILIAPRWPMRAWYSLILNMLVEIPLLLPVREDLLAQFRVFHPNPAQLSLVAWKISGVPSEHRAFQRTLSARSFSPERPEPWQATMPNGQPLLAGVVSNNWIPIRRM